MATVRSRADSSMRQAYAALAAVEARMLYRVATLALVIVTFAALAAVGIGIWLAFRHHDRNVGVGALVAGSAVASWAAGAVPCYAGMTFARFVQARTSDD